MSTQVDTSLEVIEALDFQIEKACERKCHSYDPRHEGDGKWYAKLECPNCGIDPTKFEGVQLICNKYKVAAENHRAPSICPGCKYEGEWNEFFHVVGEVE